MSNRAAPPLPDPAPPLAELLLRLATHGVPLHVYVHDDGAILRALATLTTHLTRFETRTHMALADMTATLKKIDDATSNIAADIIALKLLIVPGMAQADVDTVQGLLDKAAARLEGIAADTADPVPEVPPAV